MPLSDQTDAMSAKIDVIERLVAIEGELSKLRIQAIGKARYLLREGKADEALTVLDEVSRQGREYGIRLQAALAAGAS